MLMNRVLKITGNNGEAVYLNMGNVAYFKPLNDDDRVTEVHFISGEKYILWLKPETIYNYLNQLEKEREKGHGLWL